MKNIFTIIDSSSPAAARLDIGACLERREITVSDVAALRSSIAEAELRAGDVEMLFAAERAAVARCSEWTPFFVETVTDYIVWQARPTGILDHVQAEWLVAQVDCAKTLTAFAVLINVLAEADRVPAWLAPAARKRAAAWPEIAGAIVATDAREAA